MVLYIIYATQKGKMVDGKLKSIISWFLWQKVQTREKKQFSTFVRIEMMKARQFFLKKTVVSHSQLQLGYFLFLLSCKISYWDLLKCLYFADTTERGDRGWKEAQRQGEDRVTVQITLLCPWFDTAYKREGYSFDCCMSNS